MIDITPLDSYQHSPLSINVPAQSSNIAVAPKQSVKSHSQYFIEYMQQQQVALNINCQTNPKSDACNANIHYILKVLSKPRLRNQLPQRINLAENVLSILYNGEQAKSLFVPRLHDINSRANFFAVNDLFYQNTKMPVRWFGVASQVSRECLTGLGARHCASYLTFGSTKILGNPPIYQWRQQAGDAVLGASFDNFKQLFNGQYSDSVQWDIEQLKSEQTTLQPIHTQFLSSYRLFNTSYKTVMRLHIPKGVDILDLSARIRYGCHRMHYQPQQGCHS